MTNIERQILLNQAAIMCTLAHILEDGKLGSKYDVEVLAENYKLTSKLIDANDLEYRIYTEDDLK